MELHGPCCSLPRQPCPVTSPCPLASYHSQHACKKPSRPPRRRHRFIHAAVSQRVVYSETSVPPASPHHWRMPQHLMPPPPAPPSLHPCRRLPREPCPLSCPVPLPHSRNQHIPKAPHAFPHTVPFACVSISMPLLAKVAISCIYPTSVESRHKHHTLQHPTPPPPVPSSQHQNLLSAR